VKVSPMKGPLVRQRFKTFAFYGKRDSRIDAEGISERIAHNINKGKVISGVNWGFFIQTSSGRTLKREKQ